MLGWNLQSAYRELAGPYLGEAIAFCQDFTRAFRILPL
jgi:hypothetical protein